MMAALLAVLTAAALGVMVAFARAKDPALPLLPDPSDRRWKQDWMVTRQCMHRMMLHDEHAVLKCGPVEVWVGCHTEVNGRVIRGGKAYSKAVGAAQERGALLRLNGVDPE